MSILTLNVFSQTDTIRTYQNGTSNSDTLEWFADFNCQIGVSLGNPLYNAQVPLPPISITDPSGEPISPLYVNMRYVVSNSDNDTLLFAIDYDFMLSDTDTVFYCLHVGDTLGYICRFYDGNSWGGIHHVKDTCNYAHSSSARYFNIIGTNPLGIDEISPSKKLVRIIDETGRDAQPVPNRLLIYIYDDGTCLLYTSPSPRDS